MTSTSCEIRAVHDRETVRVYQAYNDAIADSAVEANSFRGPLEAGLWSKTRMTWIKPSKVWMAYRCGWTTMKDKNQRRVLALDLCRSGFEDLLRDAFVTAHRNENPGAARNSNVVVQWDPERYMSTDPGTKVYTTSNQEVRSIQIGLRGPAVEALLDDKLVLRITDVTSDFRKAVDYLKSGELEEARASLWEEGQEETEMEVPLDLRATLKMPEKRPRAFVVLGSAANPPHPGHLHCLEVGTKKAVELGFTVEGSTIAIAPFGYVKQKISRGAQAPPFALSDEQRLDMLDLMTRTETDRSEDGNKPSRRLEHFICPDRAYGSALECGRKLRSSEDVAVVVVVGGDRSKQKWRKPPQPENQTTICCARDPVQLKSLRDSFRNDEEEGLVQDKNYYFISEEGPPVSSTLVRGLLFSPDKDKRARLFACGYNKATVDSLLQMGQELKLRL